MHDVEYLYMAWDDEQELVDIIGKIAEECRPGPSYDCVKFPGGISFDLRMDTKNWYPNPDDVHIDPNTNQLIIPDDYRHNSYLNVEVYPFTFSSTLERFAISEGRSSCVYMGCTGNESFAGMPSDLNDHSYFSFLFYPQGSHSVKVNYIGTDRPAQLTPQVVPEPATAVMLSLFAPFILRRRNLGSGSR